MSGMMERTVLAAQIFEARHQHHGVRAGVEQVTHVLLQWCTKRTVEPCSVRKGIKRTVEKVSMQ